MWIIRDSNNDVYLCLKEPKKVRKTFTSNGTSICQRYVS